MLGDALWRRTFASDPRVVGTVVTISSQRYEVIGVAPPTFTGVRADGLPARSSGFRSAPNQTGGARAGGSRSSRLASTGDDRRGVVGGADDAGASTSRFVALRKEAATTDRPWRAKTIFDRGRGHGRAPVRDDARRARRGCWWSPARTSAASCSPRDDTAARDRGAALGASVAAGGAVPRACFAAGGAIAPALPCSRRAPRRHRNQPRDAVRRTDDAVVSSGAERDGVGGVVVPSPRGVGRLRPRAGDPADAPDVVARSPPGSTPGRRAAGASAPCCGGRSRSRPGSSSSRRCS